MIIWILDFRYLHFVTLEKKKFFQRVFGFNSEWLREQIKDNKDNRGQYHIIHIGAFTFEYIWLACCINHIFVWWIFFKLIYKSMCRILLEITQYTLTMRTLTTSIRDKQNTPRLLSSQSAKERFELNWLFYEYNCLMWSEVRINCVWFTWNVNFW